MPKKALPAPAPDDGVGHKIAEAILNFVGHIPETDERKSRKPDEAARGVATAAATKAAIAAGTLALPPGPVGWLTILPELVAVWKIQAQMVADIAAIYGKKAFLTREQMLYCLFRHMAAQAVRDFVAYFGERVFIQAGYFARPTGRRKEDRCSHHPARDWQRDRPLDSACGRARRCCLRLLRHWTGSTYRYRAFSERD